MRTLLCCCLLVLLGCEKPRPVVESIPAPYQAKGTYAAKPKVILDTDTANEIDDLYAIARLLPDTTIDLLGMTSAQWFHVWSGDSTVYRSQALNEEMLTLAGRLDLPHPIGSDLIMGKPWGDYDPRPSPATTFIIEAVKALPADEKLCVLSIGAATNLASAIAIDSSIAPRIVAYVLGFQYNHEEGYWNKDEFNIRRDLNAANYLLNQTDLELHIMPTSVAIEYTWPRTETFKRLAEKGEMGAYLRNKWEERFAQSESWVMWDVALAQALLIPDLAEEQIVLTPPENTARAVYMYSDIDFDGMWSDFWANW